MSTKQQAPVWARQESFPVKPQSGAFGFQDTRGRRVVVDSLPQLIQAIGASKRSIDLVWIAAVERMLVPDEVPELRDVLVQRRAKWAHSDVLYGKKKSAVIGLLLGWFIYSTYTKNQGNWSDVMDSPVVVVTAIVFLLFGLIPWYEGRKELSKLRAIEGDYWEKEIAEAQFDSWMGSHRAPVTFALLVLMLCLGGVQWVMSGSFFWSNAEMVERVALLKQTGDVGVEDAWWRYMTAPLVHGNLVHWVLNFAALRYLAKRVEVLAGWPHMVFVFLISALMGGVGTVQFLPYAPSVGASGGILGLLGFLLVFETLHAALVPKSVRRRLLAGLGVVVLMGLLGFRFIDNAAHVGGLVMGMVYVTLVFPKSASVMRPKVLKRDLVIGWVALLILLVAAIGVVAILIR